MSYKLPILLFPANYDTLIFLRNGIDINSQYIVYDIRQEKFDKNNALHD
jgi:hypothetical protein